MAANMEVGLSWVLIDKDHPIDLDLSCVFFDDIGKVIDAVYFKKNVSDDGSVKHSNDSRDGKESDDDEAMFLSLSTVHPSVKALVISTSCYSKHDFSRVQSGQVELRNFDTKQTLQSYDLANAGKTQSIILWTLYRNYGGWEVANVYKPCHGRTFQDFKDDMRGSLSFLIDPNLMREFQLDIRNERSFDVKKGDVVNINGLHHVMLGLGWDSYCDVDASCVLMAGDRVYDTVFYGNLKSKDKNVVHSGDNLTGDGDGDDERITVNLEKLSPEVTSLIFTVSIFTMGLNFKQVKGVFARLVNMDNNKQMFKYKINKEERMDKYNAMIVCKVYKDNNNWKFMAIGSPKNGRTAYDLKNEMPRYADVKYAPKV
ncbi:TerD domain-containing protein [Fadolivirus algeromassiliense]|jgi:tellurium resistance protein TerZ|uniref:TerD domain-containing protein n=1 Tax=Fadolivirus FV1/VV64 TaxID=3070911 RepID=A0A7D3UQF7_9VIRU|nr:TerD domain-containing protein [Fadolivirus algeromassiliense]QKF94468.1 TerD domain-containing protein [Fadolivirus FV1/VV64]